MPRLLFFAPCQRAIIDQTDKSLSLIGIIPGINVLTNEAEPVPLDAITSYSWAAASSWFPTPEDQGREFEQRIRIVRPDGQEVGDAVTAFTLTEQVHHNVVTGVSLPMGLEGTYLFRLSLREAGEDNEWQVVSEYPIMVKYAE